VFSNSAQPNISHEESSRVQSAAKRNVFFIRTPAKERVSLRSALLRRFIGRGPRFSWMQSEDYIAPSAVLPAGKRILAGRCPAPSRIAAANRARRRRPFPAILNAS